MDDRNYSRLDERQMRAVALLTSGRRVVDVAREIGVDQTTVRRWRREDADFMLAMQTAAGEVVEAAQARLGGLLDDALTAIESVLRDETAPPAARLRAAEVVLARTFDAAPKTTDVAADADPALTARALEWLRTANEQKGAGHVA